MRHPVERELADEDDAPLVVERARNFHFLPGLIVRGIHPRPSEIYFASGLIVGVDARVGTNKRWLTIFMDVDLTERGKARNEA